MPAKQRMEAKIPRLPAGKAPPQQQRGLVAREDGKHGPVDHVDQRIGYVQPPQEGNSVIRSPFRGISRPSRGSKSTPSRIGRSSAAVRSAQARTNAAASPAAEERTPPHQGPGEDAGEHVPGAVELMGHIGGLNGLRLPGAGVEADGAGPAGGQRSARQLPQTAALPGSSRSVISRRPASPAGGVS